MHRKNDLKRMEKEEFIFDRTLTKRPCIYKKVGCALYPVLYFQKAKNATNEDYEKIINYLIPKK